MSRRVSLLLGAVALAALVACDPEHAETGPRRTLDRPTIGTPIDALPLRVGDPANGEHLYRVHCAPCHGEKGRGDGPAADYLKPKPKDHTDSIGMASRTDADLFLVIAKGGVALNRSSLMPRFDDRFDECEIWDLVAFVRTLHRDATSIFGAAVAVAFHSVVLESDGSRIDFLTDPAGRAASTSEDALVVVAADGTVERIDPASATAEGHVLAERLKRAIAEEQRDVAEAARVAAACESAQETVPTIQRRFVQACGTCHGAMGRVVGPGVQSSTFRSTNFADGARQSQVDDEYLKNVIARGGTWARISDVMPAYETALPPSEIDALVRFVRALAVRPRAASAKREER
ncbi:MAG: c-type cytochrome [Planctomycetes bacterium]|nr:c-type cytochrome [Planctomycetota bacterium]MBI3844128.1 c-type cytochrome [Planctomycetota bacterium]